MPNYERKIYVQPDGTSEISVDVTTHTGGADAHHNAFIGLQDNADTQIAPAADNYIQVTDDGVINADAVGNTLALSIAQGQISHDSIADVSTSDHHVLYTDAEAIAAVEGEATLVLAGEVTIANGKSLTLLTDGDGGGLKLGAAGDVLFYRGAADTAYLATGDSFHIVAGNLSFGAASSITTGAGDLTLTPTTDVVVSNAKFLSLETDGDSGGLKLGAGADVHFYRGAADTAYLAAGDSLAIIGGNLNVTGVTDLGDGGTTDYASFAADGELTLFGTARVGRVIELPGEELGKGGTKPDESVVGNYVVQSYDIGDDSVGQFTVPHDCDTSENIEIKAHWAINEAYAVDSGEVQFRCAWSATPKDESESYAAPTHTGTGDSGDIDVPTNARELREDLVVTIPAASLSDDDDVGFTFSRIALVGGNNPTADPEILAIHVHYIMNKLGEAT